MKEHFPVALTYVALQYFDKEASCRLVKKLQGVSCSTHGRYCHVEVLYIHDSVEPLGRWRKQYLHTHEVRLWKEHVAPRVQCIVLNGMSVFQDLCNVNAAVIMNMFHLASLFAILVRSYIKSPFVSPCHPSIKCYCFIYKKKHIQASIRCLEGVS